MTKKQIILYIVLGMAAILIIDTFSTDLAAILFFLYLLSLIYLLFKLVLKIINFIKTKLNKTATNIGKSSSNRTNKGKVSTDSIPKNITKDKTVQKETKRYQQKDNDYYKRNLKNRINKYNYIDYPTRDYTVIDTETTGLSAQRDYIVEISALKIRDEHIVDRFTSLVNPQIAIPKSATDIHGITNQMVANQPTIDKVLPAFLDFIDGEILLGHNITYDLRMINSYLSENINHQLVDTMLVARKKLPQLDNHKLITIIKHYNLGDTQDHRSMSDCIYTYQVYEMLKNESK